MATKIGRMVTDLDGHLPIKSHDPLIRGLVRPHSKLKLLYLQYHNAYGDQPWQDGNLPWWTPAT